MEIQICMMFSFALLVGVGDVDGGSVEDDMTIRQVLYTAVWVYNSNHDV